uniref:Uncharacterized protein n=1 Tax=Aegilops tauschii subsp. strangulata TaxID=200361 RepID=A0A453Q2C0_AEGTS
MDLLPARPDPAQPSPRRHAFCGVNRGAGKPHRQRKDKRRLTQTLAASHPRPAGNPWRCATWPRSCGSPPLLLPGSRPPPTLLISGSHRTLALGGRPFLGSRALETGMSFSEHVMMM